MMNIALDVHTHTIASGHAYSTLQEMVTAAAAKGLKILGITDHGPSIRGASDLVYFANFHVIPRQIGDVKLLMGAEINILNTKGDLDINEDYMRKLDIRIAGIHYHYYLGGSVEDNTDALIKVMRNPHIDIISHPGDGSADLNFERIVQEAKETRILLEINNSSLNPNRGKENALNNNRQLLQLCKKYDVKVILGSDAHISYDVANYKYITPLLQEVEFPDALIVNDKPEWFMEYINSRPDVMA